MTHSPATKTRILEALKVNPNPRLIARQPGGASIGTIRQIAKAAGIEMLPRRARLSTDAREQLITALKVNPNAAQAAQQFGISRTRAAQIAKAAGIELRHGNRSKPPSLDC